MDGGVHHKDGTTRVGVVALALGNVHLVALPDRRLHQLLGEWLVVPAEMRRGILCHRFEQLFLWNAHRGSVQHKPQSTAAFSVATIFTTASASSEARPR